VLGLVVKVLSTLIIKIIAIDNGSKFICVH